MHYPSLGTSGLRVSSLCLGTMAFGGDADPATATKIYRRCRDAGITTFDCANVYNQGRAESILGKLVHDDRDELVLTTKAYFPTGPGANARGGSRYHLVRAVEASLRRLATDRIDLFFLHRFDEHTPLEETLRAVEHLVQSGKILYPAVSNFAAWQTMKALGLARQHGWAPIVCTQPMYNLVKRQAEAEILPLCQAEGLGVLPYSPLGGGLLSGKYTSTQRPPQGRLVANRMYAVRYGDTRHYDVAERFAAIARREGRHPATLAIAWVARHPAVTAPLIGCRDLDQLEPCLAAADLRLDDALYDELCALTPAPPPATDRTEERAGIEYGRLPAK